MSPSPSSASLTDCLPNLPLQPTFMLQGMHPRVTFPSKLTVFVTELKQRKFSTIFKFLSNIILFLPNLNSLTEKFAFDQCDLHEIRVEPVPSRRLVRLPIFSPLRNVVFPRKRFFQTNFAQGECENVKWMPPATHWYHTYIYKFTSHLIFQWFTHVVWWPNWKFRVGELRFWRFFFFFFT